MNYKEAISILNSDLEDDLGKITMNYRELLKRSHPDHGGNSAWFQDVRKAYKIILEQIKYFQKSFDNEGNEQTEEKNLPVELQKKLTMLLDSIADELLDIQILGAWLWCSGNTYQHKNILANLDFKFSSNKKAWYWHEGDYKKHHKKSFSLDEIAELHGKIAVEKPKKYLLTATAGQVS